LPKAQKTWCGHYSSVITRVHSINLINIELWQMDWTRSRV